MKSKKKKVKKVVKGKKSIKKATKLIATKQQQNVRHQAYLIRTKYKEEMEEAQRNSNHPGMLGAGDAQNILDKAVEELVKVAVTIV